MDGVDGSVGSIVWVRRRNGSWWPGRILGPEELSASHLMSPRSGTPVKLLGREDASVDWYNLEKSKRVKAFRCGEFNACIERAAASHGIPIKKREKYARREDAILHALELEKQQMELQDQKLGSSSRGMNSKRSGAHRKELNNVSYSYEEPRLHSKSASHKSQMSTENTILPHEEEEDLYVHKGSIGKETGWAEDNPEAIPRMRELQDFGLRIAPSKKKLSPSVWDTSSRPVNNHVGGLSDAEHVMANRSSMPMKRKRSQGGTTDVSLAKKRDRRRPLNQVLQSSANLQVSQSFQSGYDSGANSIQEQRGAVSREKRSGCVYLPAGSNDSLDTGGYPGEQMAITGLPFTTGNYPYHSDAQTEDSTSSATTEDTEETEETESDSSETESSEPDMDVKRITDTSLMLLPGSRNYEAPAVHIPEEFGDPDDGEKHYVGYGSPLDQQGQMIDSSVDAGVSKWHMKGKRNIRNLPDRPMDAMNGGGGIVTPLQKAAGRNLYHKKEPSHYAFDDGDNFESEERGHLMRYDTKRYSFAIPAASRRSHNSFNDSDSDSHLSSRLETDGPSSYVQRSYWDEADERYNYTDHYSDQMGPMLIDVELKVKAPTYQGEHVPLVSLMSRLNGKAIIGHPVQIEILEDGSTGHLLTKYDPDLDLDDNAAPSAVWKTARRSVMHRVPRSNPNEDTSPLYDSDPENKSPYFKSPKKINNHSRQSPVQGRYQKKPLKRANNSSQKTRRLSSFAEGQRQGTKSGLLNGLIKSDLAAPRVTCVPVKVVFSRILEAVRLH